MFCLHSLSLRRHKVPANCWCTGEKNRVLLLLIILTPRASVNNYFVVDGGRGLKEMGSRHNRGKGGWNGAVVRWRGEQTRDSFCGNSTCQISNPFLGLIFLHCSTQPAIIAGTSLHWPVAGCWNLPQGKKINVPLPWGDLQLPHEM